MRRAVEGVWSRCAATAVLILTAIAIARAAPAVEVERAEIRFVGRAYHYHFSALLAADAADVRAVVTDYDRLARINDNVVTSRLIERYGPTSLKRQLLIKQCLLVFCFDLNFVERVDFLPNGDITTDILPRESNFRSGTSVWRIVPVAPASTRVTLEASQEPDFWIPPIIGPLIMKRTFLAEVRETTAKIEQLAGAHDHR